ncbi:phosphopantetheine-binding protein [Micromonospora sp. NPDC047074]|uniref:phosphopantetheine-binding protein n=1 Tax=Micromonospora sp. NPDC047074 TaxID=3154339 RepID=UPI0033C8ADAC
MTITNEQQAGSTDVPGLIAGIYRETLRDDTLDVDSDFFEAGGDSLAAFQITARLQGALGLEVPVALVFAYPSPADLAAAIDEDLPGGSDD